MRRKIFLKRWKRRRWRGRGRRSGRGREEEMKERNKGQEGEARMGLRDRKEEWTNIVMGYWAGQ